MMRDAAVRRINDAIGFRPTGHSLEGTIVLRLQEAQRDLERGKSLPRFLLVEDFVLSLLAGTHTVALPPGFIRESDETRIRIVPADTLKPKFLVRRYYIDAVNANVDVAPQLPLAPTVYVLRKTGIDFVVNADQDYDLLLDYYKGADLLTANIENSWLLNAPEWLIGEAGRRIAMDLRQPDAVTVFDDMRKAGRQASLAEEIAAELASQPLRMGANL